MNAEALKIRKAEIIKLLTESGEIHHKTKTPNWMLGFELYYSETGDRNLKPGCSACYPHLLAWLKR